MSQKSSPNLTAAATAAPLPTATKTEVSQNDDIVDVYDDDMSNLAPPPLVEEDQNHDNNDDGKRDQNNDETQNESSPSAATTTASPHQKVAKQRDQVMSVVRKRMSSNRFNFDDDLDDSGNGHEHEESSENSQFLSDSANINNLASSTNSSNKKLHHHQRTESTSSHNSQRLGASITASITSTSGSGTSASNNNNNARARGSSQVLTHHPTTTPSLSAQVSMQENAQQQQPYHVPLVSEDKSNTKQEEKIDDEDNDDAQIEEQKQEQDEEMTDEERQHLEQEKWRLRKKHIFIFSDAGKPIFTRWGDESEFSELFGILQVLMEMSVSNGLGALKQVSLGSHDVHFFSDDHLRFVMVTATNEPPDTCQHQLRLLCHCLISGFPTVNKMIDRNSSYDVRNQLLHPSSFRHLIKSMNHEVPFIFRGIDCGFFDRQTRNHLSEVLLKDGFAGYSTEDSDDGGGHLMSLIVCRGKILAWAQIPNFQLSTDDLLLLIHFAERCCGGATGSSLDNNWAPLCLPDYDKEGSFWVHVMQLANTNNNNNETSAATKSSASASSSSQSNTNNNVVGTVNAAHPYHLSTSPLLIQLATHNEAISALKQSSERVKQVLFPSMDKISKNAGKVMVLPAEWAQLGVMHVLFNRWGVLAYTAPPPHAQEKKHRKNFLRSLLQVRTEALTLSKTQRPFLMRSSPFETICFTRKVVRLKSAAQGRASAELFVTFLPGTEAGAISLAVNKIWDTMLNKEAWVQFVSARQTFKID